MMCPRISGHLSIFAHLSYNLTSPCRVCTEFYCTILVPFSLHPDCVIYSMCKINENQCTVKQRRIFMDSLHGFMVSWLPMCMVRNPTSIYVHPV